MPVGEWIKSSRSGGNDGGNCVEVCNFGDGTYGVRDSKNPDGGHLRIPRGAYLALIATARAA